MSGLRSSRNLLEAPMEIRMVTAVRKHLQITNMIIPDNFGLKNCLKKSIRGDVRAQVLQVEAPIVIRMVLAVPKHLQITNMIILDNFGFNNFLKKSIPGDVRAQVLQVPVGGSHGDQDGPGCPETPANGYYDHT